jgi:hypothetical protein
MTDFLFFQGYADISLTLNIPAETHPERSEVSLKNFQAEWLSF